MKIDKLQLLTALDKTASLATRRTTLPILNSLLISSDGKRFSVRATDLDCHAQAFCECEGALEPVCVGAQVFTGLSKSANPVIELTLDNNRLKFKSNGVASLSLVPANEFPEWAAGDFKSIGLPCGDLAECIQNVHWASDPNPADTSRPLVSCVWVKCEPKLMRTAATTGQVLATESRALISSPCEFLLPSSHALRLVEALNEDESIFSLCDSWAQSRSPNLNVAVKLMTGTYFNIDTLLNQEQTKPTAWPVQDIIRAIESASMVAGSVEKFSAAKLIPNDDGCQFIYESSVNCYEVQIEMTLPHPIRFSMSLMKECLSHLISDTPQASLGVQGVIARDGDLSVSCALMTLNQPEAPVQP